MKYLSAVFFAAAFATSGFAGEWRPVFSVGQMAGAITHPWFYGRFQHKLELNHLAYVAGSRMELGIRGPRHEWYIAHFVAKGEEDSYQNYRATINNHYINGWDRKTDKYEERAFLCGYRFHPVRDDRRIAPVLGAAVVLGITERHSKRTVYRTEEISYGWQIGFIPPSKPQRVTHHFYQSSPINVGAAGEIGISFLVLRNVDALLLAQLYGHMADNISPLFWEIQEALWLPSGILQLRYTIDN